MEGERPSSMRSEVLGHCAPPTTGSAIDGGPIRSWMAETGDSDEGGRIQSAPGVSCGVPPRIVTSRLSGEGKKNKVRWGESGLVIGWMLLNRCGART